MKNSLVNPHFEIIVGNIQANIGKIIVVLLILTYLGTGAVISMSLQKALAIWGPVMSWVAAVLIGGLTQAIRGSLVYFNQANPYRISKVWEYAGIIAALLMTVYACFEVSALFAVAGIGKAAIHSAIGLIIGGFFLEAYFLGEINRTNRSVLISSPELIQQAKDYERQFTELQIVLQETKLELMHAKRKRLSGIAQKARTSATTPLEMAEEGLQLSKVEDSDKVVPEKKEGSIFDFVQNGKAKN